MRSDKMEIIKTEQPSIIFSGYFKGDRYKDEAELIAYTTFTSKTALAVLENKDATYAQYQSSKSQNILRMNDDIIIRHMIRSVNDDESIVFITIDSTKFSKTNQYVYTMYIVIVEFKDKEEYHYGSAKIKSICFVRSTFIFTNNILK
jgi:hypothetical protein